MGPVYLYDALLANTESHDESRWILIYLNANKTGATTAAFLVGWEVNKNDSYPGSPLSFPPAGEAFCNLLTIARYAHVTLNLKVTSVKGVWILSECTVRAFYQLFTRWTHIFLNP